MKRDIIYWKYLSQSLLESVEYLTEEDRKLAKHNVDLIVANRMAHAGHSTEEVHNYLLNAHPTYVTDALHHWYLSGGDVPVINFVRAVAIKAFNIDTTNLLKPHFEGIDIHPNIIHSTTINTFNNYHNAAKSAHIDLPDKIEIYRGIGIDNKNFKYIPHALESWSTDINTARRFANMSHKQDTIPAVFKATIHKNDLFSSYHGTKTRIASIIPPEDTLIGKEEHIPFGNKLHNIERIE